MLPDLISDCLLLFSFSLLAVRGSINFKTGKSAMYFLKTLFFWNNVQLLRKLKIHRIIRKTERRQKSEWTIVVKLLYSHKLFQSFQISQFKIQVISLHVYFSTNRRRTLISVMKSCYFSTTLNREKQSVQYSIRIYLFLFLKYV